jgi:methyl-accepting chemotaxis protein
VSSEIALVKKKTGDFGNTITELFRKSCAVIVVEEETLLLEKALDIVASKENTLFTKITDLDVQIVPESPNGLSIDDLDQESLFNYQRILTVSTNESKALGLLTLGISGNSEKDLVYTLIGTIITEAMVSFLLITIATLIIFHLIVSKPLTYLDQQARRVRSGDFEEEINFSSNDELGNLAQTLDTMLANLKESYQAREDHKAHL